MEYKLKILKYRKNNRQQSISEKFLIITKEEHAFSILIEGNVSKVFEFSERKRENQKKLRKTLQSLTLCNIIIKVLFAEV